MKAIITHRNFMISEQFTQSVSVAASENFQTILRLLIERYKDIAYQIDNCTVDNKTALMYCIEYKNDHGAAALINAGALERERNRSKIYDMLLDVINKRMPLCARSILSNKRYVFTVKALPAVLVALQSQQYDVIPLIFSDARQHTIHFKQFVYEDKTLIEHAFESGHPETVTLLLSYSAQSLLSYFIQSIRDNAVHEVGLILESKRLHLEDALVESIHQAMSTKSLPSIVPLFYADAACDAADWESVEQPLIAAKLVESPAPIVVKKFDNVNATLHPSVSIWMRRLERPGLGVSISNNLSNTNASDAATQTSRHQLMNG